MASNNHKKRRSHLATPVEESNQTNSSAASPPKKARQALASSTNPGRENFPLQQQQQRRRTNDDSKQFSTKLCGLGLRRIRSTNRTADSRQTNQEEQLGPLIHLLPSMYLGRTPPYMALVMKSCKSLDKTWTRKDFCQFFQKHEIAKKHAMLGIGRDDSFSKKENEYVMSVSRMLLQVTKIDSLPNQQSLTLKRCREARKSDGRLAKQTPVRVYRCKPSLHSPKGIENEVNSSQSSSGTNIGSTKNSGTITVQPDSTVVLKEGDVLMILNDNYRYKVVNTLPKPNTPKASKSIISEPRGSQSDAIEILDSSSGSSSDGISLGRSRVDRSRSSFGRRSLSSMNDRTIVLRDDDDEVDSFEMKIRAATKLSLEESRKRHTTPISKKQEIIYVQSSSDSEEGEKKPSTTKLSKDYKFETPNCKPAAATNKLPEPSRDSNGTRSKQRSNAKVAKTSTNNKSKKNIQKNTDAKPQITRKSTRLRRSSRNFAASAIDENAQQSKTTTVESNKQGAITEEKPGEDPNIGPILLLESPTKRFWDTSWSGDGELMDSAAAAATYVRETIQKQSNANDSASPPAVVSEMPHPTDTSASMGLFYWNALNSARPREGAWYLNASLVAANTVPGPSLCQKWMALLTWGPNPIADSSNNKSKKKGKRGFPWDGPRLDYSMGLWKKALALHPQILLRRMAVAAPGGPLEWWKTCLTYDDIVEEEHSNQEEEIAFVGKDSKVVDPAEAAQKRIHCLRMRSARLEAFLYLMEANIKFEKEHHERLRIDQEQAKLKQPRTEGKARNARDDQDEEDYSSSDEDDREDGADRMDREKPLVLLQEIRSFGTKPVLRLVAQAMSKFWVSQRNYLGYSSEKDHLDCNYCLEQEHSEIVEEVAEQLSNILGVIRKILESPYNATPVAPDAPSRRRTRRLGNLESQLSHKDIIDILWNSMDLEIERRVKSPRQKRRAKQPPRNEFYKEPQPKDAFLLEWIWSLQESMGQEFAVELAEKVGVIEHLQDLWEL